MSPSRKFLSVVLALVVSTGCASSTVLRSYPPGATIKAASGSVVGITPYEYSDSATVGHTESFTIEKEGYDPEFVTIKKDQWNGGKTIASVAGGLFFFFPFAGLLWSADYRPDYAVQLKKAVVEERRESSDEEEDDEEEAPVQPKHRKSARSKLSNR